MSDPFNEKRKGTGRPVTGGSVQIAAGGVTASTSVNFAERPLSNRGLEGARTQSGQRVFRDAPYYATRLRGQIQKVNEETSSLQNSSSELRKKEQTTQRLEQSVNELRVRSGELQGELFDVTYAQSKLREGASLENLRSEATEAEESAAKLRSEANIAFKAREDALGRLEKNEAAALKMRQDTEARIQADLGDQAARQFRELSQENTQLAHQEQELRKRLQEQAAVTANAYAAAVVLQNQQNQQSIARAIELHRQTRACKREVDQLRAELSRDQAEDPEFSIKQQLKNQIKQESGDCKAIMDDIKNLEQSTANRKRILTEITPDVMTAVTKEQKDIIKSVLRGERQLADWPRQKTELQANLTRLQQQAMVLLQRLPNPISTAGGSGEGAGVEQQLTQKTRELERLSEQEGKVLSELREVSTQVSELQETLSGLQRAVMDAESVEDVAAVETQLKKDLADQADKQKQLQEHLREVLGALGGVEEQAGANENVKTVRELFGSLGQSLAKQYQAEAYIRAREAESDYSKEKGAAQALLGELQGILSKK